METSCREHGAVAFTYLSVPTNKYNVDSVSSKKSFDVLSFCLQEMFLIYEPLTKFCLSTSYDLAKNSRTTVAALFNMCERLCLRKGGFSL